MKLQLYVIHTTSLTERQPRLHGTIQTIRDNVQNCGMDFSVQMVLKPDPEHLAPTIQELDKRVKYEPVGVEMFDKAISVLGIEEISNYEKHRHAWSKISQELDDATIHMVIEDDTFLLPDAVQSFKELLKADHSKYDIITLCLSDKDATPSAPLQFKEFRETGSVLPSKDAYFISKRAAKVFLAQSETITFAMRFQMSYILHKNASLEVVYPSKRMFLEGSKLGFYPSSIHPNNLLIYNQEFMELWQMVNEDKPALKRARDIFKSVAHVRNPDIMHLYAVILFKCKEYMEAESILQEAADEVLKHKGLLNFKSDILNNLINIQEFIQNDVEELKKKPSKYSLKN